MSDEEKKCTTTLRNYYTSRTTLLRKLFRHIADLLK